MKRSGGAQVSVSAGGCREERVLGPLTPPPQPKTILRFTQSAEVQQDSSLGPHFTPPRLETPVRAEG